MSDKIVEIDGIKYFTLLERPSDDKRDAPLILLCHALMSNMKMWDQTVAALNGAGYATLRFDHVGHNQTPPPANGTATLHIDDITRHMHQIVETTTGQTHLIAVIGCSIGGVLALRYAMLFSQDVDYAVSIAAPGITSPESAKQLWTQRIEQFEQDQRAGNDTLCHATVGRWFPGERSEDDAVRAAALKHVRMCTLAGYRILADAIRKYDFAEEVRGIKGVKCLVMAGSEDSAVSPGLLKDLSSRIPAAQFVCMEGAGHLPPMHKAEEFNGVVLAFLGS